MDGFVDLVTGEGHLAGALFVLLAHRGPHVGCDDVGADGGLGRRAHEFDIGRGAGPA